MWSAEQELKLCNIQNEPVKIDVGLLNHKTHSWWKRFYVLGSPNLGFGSVAATQRATSPPSVQSSPKQFVTRFLRPFPSVLVVLLQNSLLRLAGNDKRNMICSTKSLTNLENCTISQSEVPIGWKSSWGVISSETIHRADTLWKSVYTFCLSATDTNAIRRMGDGGSVITGQVHKLI